jgi:integrase
MLTNPGTIHFALWPERSGGKNICVCSAASLKTATMNQDFVKRFDSSERNISEKTRMLAVLAEPARTIVLLASWTGLRQGEICGVRWKDFDGKTLKISRSIWKKNVINPPKTASSAAPL